ncbi:Fic family protein [Nesterenkonia sp. CF4.4]|uniref:Fic family protein n=1 Tax=Nesterenkonia sp. CF4.4 TaxID=3373079 RepID=UPI003EE5CF4B
MDPHQDQSLTVAELNPVIYSAGRVFDDLSATSAATEEFLQAGSSGFVGSPADLVLLEDLRDIAQRTLDHTNAGVGLDTEFVCDLNASITRSGPLHPGQLRREDQRIGVSTHYGIHAPPAIGDAELQGLITRALESGSVREQALSLFGAIAKAQPFEDGNKRTAIFAANALLLQESSGVMLTVPLGVVDGVELSERFSDLLARAYLFGENDGLKGLLRDRGFVAHASAATSRPRERAD